jgi:hypothetical protein
MLLAGKRKSPTAAFVYALVPGTFCIMGIGHFYTRRRLRGAFLLAIGFVLGLLAWASVFGVVAHMEDAFLDYFVVSLLFVVPFAALLSWSAFDAAKQARLFNARALVTRPKDDVEGGTREEP